jgi:hypothetical protein
VIDYKVGDVRDVLATIPDGGIDLIASSPPFLALRSYLPPDHEHKHAEIGSEPDPATFLDTLLGLTAEWCRVLSPFGSIAIELGDTYAGSGGAGGDYSTDGLRSGQQAFAGSAGVGRVGRVGKDRDPQGFTGRSSHGAPGGNGWPNAKSLALIPQLYAVALAYGVNPLTGRPSPVGRMLVRNVVVWHRPNPAVGALGDKYRPSTSYIVVATRSPKRWFDLTAVRGEPSPNTHARTAKGVEARQTTGKAADRDGNWHSLATTHRTEGAPPLDAWFDQHDTWTVTTQPSRLAHYAMWPPKLAERLVLSMCPQSVCTVCGEPRRRVERASDAYAAVRAEVGDFKTGHDRGTGLNGNTQYVNGQHIERAEYETVGWSDCGHDNWRPGVVLDPFAGTGTTLAAADCHGRDAVGIDIDARNRDLLPARMDEVRKALFGVKPELPGQTSLFGESA